MMTGQWQVRSPERMPEHVWRATMTRVRGEFEEMPCLRVTREQARMLFGLHGATSEWVLNRLAQEGFLVQTPDGQYVRRNAAP
jgi:hypothetical protein